MITREEVHDILSAVLEAEPTQSEPQQFDIVRGILNDNFVTLMAQSQMIKHFAAQPIREMQPLERQRLRTKMRLAPAPVVTTNDGWGVSMSETTGKYYVFFRRGSEVHRWFGDPRDKEAVKQIVFFGEPIPRPILEQYVRALRDTSVTPAGRASYDDAL